MARITNPSECRQRQLQIWKISSKLFRKLM